jgi:hypothetical protein
MGAVDIINEDWDLVISSEKRYAEPCEKMVDHMSWSLAKSATNSSQCVKPMDTYPPIPHVKAIINLVGSLGICGFSSAEVSSSEVMVEDESQSLRLEVSKWISLAAVEDIGSAIMDEVGPRAVERLVERLVEREAAPNLPAQFEYC